MTKTAGVFFALLVVGIVVTSRAHSSGPVCPATSTSHVATTPESGR